jgi:LysM repeat protein
MQNTPGFSSDSEYDDYDDLYRDRNMTNIGLPPGQLALLIGVNAVISLIISVAVVLIANRQALPGDIATATMPVAAAPTVAVPAGNPTSANVPPTEVTRLESVTYEVQAGDTLGLIAQKFSVPLFDLMLANGLSDEDFIQIGQKLIIPLGGLPDVTPTFTAVPLPTETTLPFDPPTPLPGDATLPAEPAAIVGPSPTAMPAPSPNATAPVATGEIKVVVNEVLGAGELTQETLMILNRGAGTSLMNWKLSGSPLGNFVFPDIFLFSGGSIRIHTSAGQNTPSDLYLGQGEAAWLPGTTIILSDAAGKQMSQLTVPATPQ